MLNARHAILGLALFFAVTADSWGQSQQSPPNTGVTNQPPQTQTNTTEQPPAAYGRGTEQSPTFVKILPLQKTEAEAKQEAEDREEKSSTDRWLVRWTGAVAIFTFVLGALGGWQAREEFIATHRPKIKIHAVEITHREVGKQTFIGASILAFNTGESVAKNVEVRGEIFMGPRFALDVQRPLVKTFDEVLSGQKLRAEITSEWEASYAAAGKRTGIICYCLGWIAYRDENGQRRETGFCFQPEFSADGDRWVSAGKPEYEYSY
jgi:hypothetical protein